jgi:hypothetical protein
LPIRLDIWRLAQDWTTACVGGSDGDLALIVTAQDSRFDSVKSMFKLGCYLGEMFYLTELADWLRANGRNRFLFTGPPLRLPSTVGSPATPVATV